MELNDFLSLPYTITLRLDDEGDWIARVQELKGCTAHGGTQAEALADLEQAKREWLQAALEDEIPIPLPESDDHLPSGKWVQRVPRRLHRDLTALAESEGTSLTQLCVMILSQYVGASQARERGQHTESQWRESSAAHVYWAMAGHPLTLSDRSRQVLRSLCVRLPREMKVNARTIEQEDVHVGKR